MRIGILGSGLMGGKLGTLLARAGHEVVFSYARSEVKLPLAGYALLVLCALIALSHAHEALLGVAAAALLLLFVGIHNAWDAIAYHVFVNMRKGKE